MAQSFRQTEILQFARTDGRVLVEDMAARFGVSLQTIRRDLAALCDSGALARVHGGAMLPSGVANIGYEDRRQIAAEAKARIAAACAAEIPNGASIFLNIGTTTESVARALLGHRDLLVVTNNINVANILANAGVAEIVVAGGTLRPSDGGLVGDATADFIRQFKLDYAVIGASALDHEGDLLDFDFREVRVTQAILASARQSFLVADAGKFTRKAPVRVAGLGSLDAFFTDAPLPVAVGRLCATGQTRVVVA
jgi:DeoR family glycerol-3-phosphate regulon repressor